MAARARPVAEDLAERIQGLHGELPAAVRETCERLLVDVAGLCLVARRRDYVKAALAGFGEAGVATAIELVRAEGRVIGFMMVRGISWWCGPALSAASRVSTFSLSVTLPPRRSRHPRLRMYQR